jgi:hypothetical protein
VIVRWENEEGVSHFDCVLHITKLNGEAIVKMTRSTLDHNVVVHEIDHGSVTILSEKAVVVTQYDLGPKPVTQSQ